MNYTVAVRALCEFTAKEGDLDLRFTPSPTAQEGIAGHALIRTRRGPEYQAEISLNGEYGQLRVRGRADGYDPVRNQLEEIKTYRGDLSRMPDNHRKLHWAQVKVYGHLLCEKLCLPNVQLALVYFDIVQQTETVIVESFSAATLRQYFDEQCSRFVAWAQRELSHRTARDAALAALKFPHHAFRPGQRPLAEAVYKAASNKRCLLAQAPTGIGKTIGTLFPLLKACPTQQLDKLFFLTAKTPGRHLALDALATLKQAQKTPLRVLELVARDKACEHPDKACHGESCPLAQGFYDRLPQARAAALAHCDNALDKPAVREIALQHQVCPYYLSQDLARWSDVIIGDYNYYFDISALLHGLTVANEWRIGVLVDEAHNMIERARKMYSAELHQSSLNQVRRHAAPALKKPLDRLYRSWNELHRDQSDAYQVYAVVPAKFDAALRHALSAITEYLTDNPTTVDAALQGFYFDALHFSRMVELHDTHSLFDIEKGARHASEGGVQLCIRNVIPAPFLAPRFAAAHCTVLFSATLSPWHFYSDTLGLPEQSAWIDVESPFDAQQLSVHIESRISTRYRDRDKSVAPIVELIARQYRQQPGNYLAFFSSFDYLQQVMSALSECHPELTVWTQSRRMDEAEREQFLARFTRDGHGIGFAVLGGAFAEGIDLPGQRLIGAFIATLGLPQVNPVNQQIMQRMDAVFGSGYDYTYHYPGIQKVVQAAGRVIRTQQDRGTVYLIDDRFQRADVRRLLPRWWKVQG